MTSKQENSVRGASKLLRTVFAEDMESCASILTAEAEILLKAGYKAVEVTANGPFQVTLVLYLKYNHLNR